MTKKPTRLSTASSSISAAPTPIVIAPMTWLRADFGFRMRPAAQTASMRRTRISPVAASTPTSTKCAPKVDCWYFLARSPNSMRSSATSPAAPAASASGDAAAAGSDLAVGEDRVGRFEAELLRHRFAQLHAGRIDAGGRAVAAPHCPPEPAETGKGRVAEPHHTWSSGTPIISAAVCAMMV